jgi:hypothetical protein
MSCENTPDTSICKQVVVALVGGKPNFIGIFNILLKFTQIPIIFLFKLINHALVLLSIEISD